MVLRGKLRGRVGHCREYFSKPASSNDGAGFFVSWGAGEGMGMGTGKKPPLPLPRSTIHPRPRRLALLTQDRASSVVPAGVPDLVAISEPDLLSLICLYAHSQVYLYAQNPDDPETIRSQRTDDLNTSHRDYRYCTSCRPHCHPPPKPQTPLGHSRDDDHNKQTNPQPSRPLAVRSPRPQPPAPAPCPPPSAHTTRSWLNHKLLRESKSLLPLQPPPIPQLPCSAIETISRTSQDPLSMKYQE